MLDRIATILRTFDSATPVLPATQLYNEGWMLRLALDWYSSNEAREVPLRFLKGSRWFSEALLPSHFRPRNREDRTAESWTHADGVIGHFTCSGAGGARLFLTPDAKQFVVTEAKLNSPLSGGTKNAPGFDQAARNVACIAEVLFEAKRRPRDVERIAFFVVAPVETVSAGVFAPLIEKASIEQKVRLRVASYSPRDTAWLEEWFLPTLERIELGTLTWEGVSQDIASQDPDYGSAYAVFYAKCRAANRVATPRPEA